MRSSTRVIILLLLSCTITTRLFAQNEEALKHARAGFALEQKKQYPQALYEYNASVQADPKYPYPLARIGAMYQLLKNFPLAIDYYNRAIRLDSVYDVYNYFNIGLAYRVVQKHDSAVIAMKEFLRRMDPVTAADSATMRDADFWIKFNLGCIAEKLKPRNTEEPHVVADLNSPYDDFAPSITADGQTIYITSRRLGTNKSQTIETSDYGDDVFVSRRDSAGHWTKPAFLPAPLNSLDDEGAASISADGLTLYFSSCRRPEGQGDCDIYMSELIGEQWTKPQNLGTRVNSPAWDGQPSVTADGSTMYFSSRREGSVDGSEDIYVSYRTPDGLWTTAQNVGETINTRFSERCPFISADGKTLYFSSNGHPGYGNHDLFLSRKLDDGTWSVPQNLGSPINNYGDDVFMTIAASGDKMYYATQRADARADLNIYEAKLPPKLQPGPVTLVAGTVRDARTLQPIGARIEVNDLKADQLVAVYRANKVTGKYYVTLGTGKMYGITAKAPGYIFYSDNYTVPDTISYREVTHDLLLQPVDTLLAVNTGKPTPGTTKPGTGIDTGTQHPTKPSKPGTTPTKPGTKPGTTPSKPGTTPTQPSKPTTPGTTPTKPTTSPTTGSTAGMDTVQLKNVFFDFNQSTLRPESRTELRNLTDLLKQYPSMRIEIDGHTDNVGGDDFNLRLSLDRATAVKTYLVSNGIAAKRLVAKGFGSTKPKASNDTEEGRQLNRRTEFTILK